MRNYLSYRNIFGLGLSLMLASVSVFSQSPISRTIYAKLIPSQATTTPSQSPGSRGSLDLSKFAGIQSHAAIKYDLSAKKSGRSTGSKKSSYLEGIVKIQVDESMSLEDWVREIASYDNVLYAEAAPTVQMLLLPNDPHLTNQDYLNTIKAYEAWNVTTGDPSIVIAISDNGTDYTHVDLLDKVSVNEDDPINGLDDDNNGFIDDYNGWDMADGDNDPFADAPTGNPSHGTMVAGIAAAHTNNGQGMAGVGYASSFLPVKIFSSSNGNSSNSFESIIYAADRGCQVINLSWGYVGEYSSLLQDIINYAVLEKDAVVVAAAGNTNASLDFYPASYDHVLSVGMTDANDQKHSNATFSYKIDLMAPGASVYGTKNGNAYGTGLGSSFAAPQVSATAALVRAVFPEMNAIQVMEQIRMTSDDIYGVGNNSEYSGQLGKGRLNVYRAVSEVNVAAIRSFGFSYEGPFGELLFADDTVAVTLSFVNLLRAVEGAKVNLSTLSPYAEVLNKEVVLGDLGPFDSLAQITIKVRLKAALPSDTDLAIKMSYTDVKGYEDFEYFNLTSAPPYLNMDNHQIALTVAADGRLGYADDLLMNGLGLRYKGDEVSYALGIMVGHHPDSISDNVMNNFTELAFEKDMQAIQPIRFIKRADVSLYSLGSFSDDRAVNPHGLIIEQEFLIWEEDLQNDFLIAEYRLTNTRNHDKSNMKLGFFADFNLGTLSKNYVGWDTGHRLAYTYSHEDPDLMVGVALLTEQEPVAHAIDLFDQNRQPIDVAIEFSGQLKFDMMNREKTSAGGVDGNDVAQLLTANLGTLGAYGSSKIAYALVFGSSEAELVTQVGFAKTKYDIFIHTPPINRVEATCANEELVLTNEDPIAIYSDVQGTDLVMSGLHLNLGIFETDTLLYYKELIGGYESDLYAMNVVMANPEVDFKANPDLLYLDDDPEHRVQFQDLSLGAESWQWDFGNGSFSTRQNPQTGYHEVGTYLITFTAQSSIGCSESVSRNYEVRTRGEPPILEDQMICRGSNTTIAASNSNALRFYESQQATEPFFEGEEYKVVALNASKTYYVSSVATPDESIRVPVVIAMDPVKADFTHRPDTVDFSSSTMMQIIDQSTDAKFITWTVNEEAQSAASSFSYNYEGLTDLNVTQVATSELGCASFMQQAIALLPTSRGGIAAQQICAWDSVVVGPDYGEYFIFYVDENKSEIIEKGKVARFGPILRDTTFYISNVTNYLESELIACDVDVDEFEINILADPDSLDIDHGRNVFFEIDHPETTSVRWIQNDGQQALVVAPVFSYTAVGDYLLTAIAVSAGGCSDTAQLTYKVYSILGLDDSSVFVTVYPNPATHRLHLNFQGRLSLSRLYDTIGRSYDMDWQSTTKGAFVNVEQLPPGLYILQGELDQHSFTLKFTKSP